MKVWIDSKEMFDDGQMEIRVGGVKRSFVESAAAGLDGVLRIDLGQRGRAIKQKGVLRAKSNSEMEEKIREIGTYQDGDVHTMADSESRSFSNVCIDSFTAGEIKASGGGVICEYEIVYSQLKV